MTINEYAKATNTLPHTVRKRILKGLPHTPPTDIQIDFDAAEKWKATELKPRGRPARKESAA